jgi:hypothetical protein
MISKEEFKEIEKQYNSWLYKHPKGDHNYKSFSHMRRSIEFAKYYSGNLVKKLTIPVVVVPKGTLCDKKQSPYDIDSNTYVGRKVGKSDM